MTNRMIVLIVLCLPVIVPAGMLADILWSRHQAPVYEVNITGYDPRDLLYGRYIRFRYDVAGTVKTPDFPADMAEIVKKLPMRYYLDERYATQAERILGRQEHAIKIGVGVPSRGKPFIKDIYVDGVPIEEAVRRELAGPDFKDRVDLHRDAEGQ